VSTTEELWLGPWLDDGGISSRRSSKIAFPKEELEFNRNLVKQQVRIEDVLQH
jgi:hypothetical protein